ncbi:hypothetical protein CBG55_04390 [Prevotella intermedia]|nr:hypothetical protein CBG55_04390 [Prevotella intermedia]
MPPCGFFLADSFFEKIYIYREVVQEASATSFDVGRWVKKRPIIFLDFGVLNLVLRMKVLSRDKWSASLH